MSKNDDAKTDEASRFSFKERLVSTTSLNWLFFINVALEWVKNRKRNWMNRTEPLRELLNSYFPVVGPTVSRVVRFSIYPVVATPVILLAAIFAFILHPAPDSVVASLISSVPEVKSWVILLWSEYPIHISSVLIIGYGLLSRRRAKGLSLLYYRKPSAKTALTPLLLSCAFVGVVGASLLTITPVSLTNSIVGPLSLVVSAGLAARFARKLVYDDARTSTLSPPVDLVMITTRVPLLVAFFALLIGGTGAFTLSVISGGVMFSTVSSLAYGGWHAINARKYTVEEIESNLGNSGRQGVLQDLFIDVDVHDGDVLYSIELNGTLPERMYTKSEDYQVAKRKARDIARFADDHLTSASSEQDVQPVIEKVGDVIEEIDEIQEDEENVEGEKDFEISWQGDSPSGWD